MFTSDREPWSEKARLTLKATAEYNLSLQLELPPPTKNNISVQEEPSTRDQLEEYFIPRKNYDLASVLPETVL